MSAATMPAARFMGEGELLVDDVSVPRLTASDEVLLAVKAVGICGTDLHILEVPPGHPATPGVILGHEYCGEVVDVGSSVTAVG
ncbi:MAG: alcohol dehydrogenase catalytic domain-containing protein [Salinibacter sp.]